MSSTPPPLTWKRLLVLTVTQLAAFVILVHIIDNQLPLPVLVVGYSVVFILGFVGLFTVLD
jgi:hypothetical protein